MVIAWGGGGVVLKHTFYGSRGLKNWKECLVRFSPTNERMFYFFPSNKTRGRAIRFSANEIISSSVTAQIWTEFLSPSGLSEVARGKQSNSCTPSNIVTFSLRVWDFEVWVCLTVTPRLSTSGLVNIHAAHLTYAGTWRPLPAWSPADQQVHLTNNKNSTPEFVKAKYYRPTGLLCTSRNFGQN